MQNWAALLEKISTDDDIRTVLLIHSTNGEWQPTIAKLIAAAPLDKEGGIETMRIELGFHPRGNISSAPWFPLSGMILMMILIDDNK